MSNLFSGDDYPTAGPDVLTIEDRWLRKHTELGLDYPHASYTFPYNARLQDVGSTAISIIASKSAED